MLRLKVLSCESYVTTIILTVIIKVLDCEIFQFRNNKHNYPYKGFVFQVDKFIIVQINMMCGYKEICGQLITINEKLNCFSTQKESFRMSIRSNLLKNTRSFEISDMDYY